MAAYTWNREEQMFIALGKEFDMFSCNSLTIEKNHQVFTTERSADSISFGNTIHQLYD